MNKRYSRLPSKPMMYHYQPFKRLHIDWILLFGLLCLTSLGFIVLYSASDQNSHLLVRQIIRLVIAFGIMLAIAQISPDKLKRWSIWIYTIGLIMLILVLLFGTIGKGAQRWLNLGFFRFQPSEIMKVAVPMMVAAYLSKHSLPPNLKQLFISLLIIIVPTLLIAKQPDLGTALLTAVAGIFVLLLSGVSWRLIIGLTSSVIAFIPIAWTYLLHDYQRQRVLTLLNPESDPLHTGYHIIQSKIAIGSGGFTGKGWLEGTQSHLQFLPERSTDFIFAVYAEEFGLMGAVLLLLIYLFIILRGLYIATQGQESYSRLLAGSLILTFFIYIFINIGMVNGILPVVGVPLPLISYGGTSMVTLMATFGMVMSIYTHRKLLAN